MQNFDIQLKQRTFTMKLRNTKKIKSNEDKYENFRQQEVQESCTQD